MAEVSIIVPVYQVEEYLCQCIDSILAQTFKDFELILVDDGSKDRSGMICDRYALMDDRILAIHKDNGGLSDARNVGINKANGKYIMFVDSDDYISEFMLERLYMNMKSQDADIVACNFTYFFEEDQKKNFSTCAKYEILTAQEIFLYRKNERNYGVWTVAWNKLYKKGIFNNVCFRCGKYHEDEFFANEIYQKNIQVVMIADCLYYYRQRKNSIMSIINPQKEIDRIEAYQERMQIYMENNIAWNETYKVLIYSLEYLSECKKIKLDTKQKNKFHKLELITKKIATQLRKRKEISFPKKLSLLLISLNPNITFQIAIRFRKILEQYL